ncbi:MAG: YceI family protein [Cyclobacteriaceae bacterium]|nr:YceI family protein [Cyclobacteriaceae bacterium]
MKWRLFLGLFWVMALEGSAQKFVAEKSVITFFSDALIEDITATNSKAVSLFNRQTGEVAFSIPIREFQFEKKLMQEHFNEKYMESEKYPKALFSGVLQNFDGSLTGVQNVKAKGKLTIHGVTREVEISGTAEVGNKITLKSKFPVKLADYKVEIPQLVFQNIAETVDVTIDITYKPQ